MIKKHYEGSSKRALNIVWNAAGRYDFEPPFLAFYSNGKPDQYFNMIIGLAVKWFDISKIQAFFDSYSYSKKAPEFDSYMWLAIENCIFEKEKSIRPIMPRLRIKRAEEFYDTIKNYSRQQMEMQSIPVLNQEEARWAYVLGKKAYLLSDKERRLERSLLLDKSLDTDGLLQALKGILKEYFGFDTDKVNKEGKRNLNISLAKSLQKVLKKKNKETETLFVRNGTGSGNREGSVTLVHEDHFINNQETAKKSREYIESYFGRCIYTDEEMRILEKDICIDNDEYCHVWITDGIHDNNVSTIAKENKNQINKEQLNKEQINIEQIKKEQIIKKQINNEQLNKEQINKEHIKKDQIKTNQIKTNQIKKNIAFYTNRSYQIHESIRNLSAQISTIFESYLQSLPQESKSGALESSKAYRLAVMNDTRVFLNEGDEKDYKITVDILLDASQSRMNFQESIACEAYIIAESFVKAHIPVSIRAFRSIRGYTVLENLKSYKDRQSHGAFNYVAAGWNRDGLCFKMMDHLYMDEEEQDTERFLFVLTDASPNDSMPIRNKGTGLRAKEYEGLVAVEDARLAVQKLKSHNISIGAVFFGSAMHLDNVSVIYGDDYERIVNMRQLPDAVGNLLRRQLQRKSL